MRVLSLYSGCSGSDCGFQAVPGVEIVMAVEPWEPAVQTYTANLDGAPLQMTVEAIPLDWYPGEIDVVIGGPPCQSFSKARVTNKLSGEGLKNFYSYSRVVEHVKPSVFVIENVPEVDRVDISAAIIGMFPNYNILSMELNAVHFGVPQDRRRRFFFGTKRDQPMFRFRVPSNHWSKWYTGWADYLDIAITGMGLVVREDKRIVRSYAEASFCVTGIDHMAIRYGGYTLNRDMNKLEREVRGIQSRKLTINELARLQGFPEGYKVFGTLDEQQRQIGNAWCVNVAEEIATQLRNYLR